MMMEVEGSCKESTHHMPSCSPSPIHLSVLHLHTHPPVRQPHTAPPLHATHRILPDVLVQRLHIIQLHALEEQPRLLQGGNGEGLGGVGTRGVACT